MDIDALVPKNHLLRKIEKAMDRNGFVLGIEITAGNVSDSVAWDRVYEEVTERFPESKYIVIDAGHKTPWIAKRTLDDGRIPILPYTRKDYKEGTYRPWD